jgi:hypothetical protein
MSCWQVVVLPQSSVAVQVRVTILRVGQGPPAILSANVTVGLASQLSVALALPVALGSVEPLQATATSGGQVSTGGVVSCTVIIWLQTFVFPWQSLAVHVRVITIVPRQGPSVMLSANVTVGRGSHLSRAVALPIILKSFQVLQVAVLSGGQAMTGGV